MKMKKDVKRPSKYKKDKIYLSHKIEIYPDEYAKSILTTNFDYQRFLYNLGIARYKLCRKECIEIGEPFLIIGSFFFHTFFQSPRRERRNFEHDRKIIGKVRDSAAKALTSAYYNWFVNPEEFNEPTFHKKGKYRRSFTIPVFKKSPGQNPDIQFIGNELIFPKLRIYTGHGNNYKVLGHCYISELPRFKESDGCTLKSATFSESMGHYYVSVSYEIDKNPYKKTISTKTIGIDLGIKNFATCVDSDKKIFLIKNQVEKMINLEKRIDYYKSRLRRCYEINNKKRTNNYWRWRKKYQRCWFRLVNLRRDFLHKFTTELSEKYGIIKIEDLCVSELISDKKRCSSLNRKNGSSCFYMFREILEYKCTLREVHLQLVDRYFPSTKKCTRCGSIKSMPLKERMYECPKCGLKLDRDVNAAFNILMEANQIKTLV